MGSDWRLHFEKRTLVERAADVAAAVDASDFERARKSLNLLGGVVSSLRAEIKRRLPDGIPAN